MKTLTRFLFNSFIALLAAGSTYSQSIDVHNFIGKPRNEVVKKFGNPVHKDESNPDMICMFYKGKTGSMIFVSDRKVVYQAEATQMMNTEDDARNKVSSFITESIANGFEVDTISVNDYQLQKPGTKVDLQCYENKISKNFELRVKARRTEN